ncbi:MAG: YraN family protein [Bacteroidales bacterium]|nr:YraN family protein [Bacteroidales bacterium]MDD6773751.1 YraN family protein [Bacteroidales bacterium]MDO4212653.1 YraN family protein [Bacteroidales bacterium]
MKNDKQAVGRRGEDLACEHLVGLGHTILERNWRHSHLEIDIVSRLHNELHIVEVKSRTAPLMAAPEENVDWKKRQRLVKAARAYLGSRDREALPPDVEILFDVLTVVFNGPEFAIEYYPQAFIPTYA